MFESIKRRWAEARSDMAAKEVEEILARYSRMNPNEKYFVSSAFTSVLSAFEDQTGPMSEWNIEKKKKLAKEILAGARKAMGTRGDNIHAETSKLGAHGTALLSLYLELQTLPGDRAKTALEAVRNWSTSL